MTPVLWYPDKELTSSQRWSLLRHVEGSLLSVLIQLNDSFFFFNVPIRTEVFGDIWGTLFGKQTVWNKFLINIILKLKDYFVNIFL